MGFRVAPRFISPGEHKCLFAANKTAVCKRDRALKVCVCGGGAFTWAPFFVSPIVACFKVTNNKNQFMPHRLYFIQSEGNN